MVDKINPTSEFASGGFVLSDTDNDLGGFATPLSFSIFSFIIQGGLYGGQWNFDTSEVDFHKIADMSPFVWYNVKVQFDTSKQTYDCWVTEVGTEYDTPSATDIPFFAENSKIDKITFAEGSHFDQVIHNVDGWMWVDDIDYEWTPKLVEPQENLFALQWSDIMGYTGTNTGDSINLDFELTDIFGTTETYTYSFTVDYDIPISEIILSTGAEDYETLPATPLTTINFNCLNDVPFKEEYRIFDVSSFEGKLPGVYDFESEDFGDDPLGWQIEESGDSDISIITDMDNPNNNIVQLYTAPNDPSPLMFQDTLPSVEEGIVEFKIRVDALDPLKPSAAFISSSWNNPGTYDAFGAFVVDDGLYDAVGFDKIADMSIDTWYKVKVKFSTITESWDCWVVEAGQPYGAVSAANRPFISSTVDAINVLAFAEGQEFGSGPFEHEGWAWYDDITYSWDSQDIYFTDWIEFDSSIISTLGDLTYLPDIFRIDYRVTDSAGNVGTVSDYNSGFEFIKFSREIFDLVSVIDRINLNNPSERVLTFLDGGQFNNINELKVLVNGFNYGTATLDNGFYTIDFGTENTIYTLLAYSDSLLSPNIHSNLNPVNHISFEVREDDVYGVVKHVLVNGETVIINPLTYNQTYVLDINELYTKGVVLEDYIRPISIYYRNASNANQTVLIPSSDIIFTEKGYVFWPEHSIVHQLYYDNEEVVGGYIYIDYAASQVADQLTLTNADGFVIDFVMPTTYSTHTTIEKLNIFFTDYLGNSFSKVLFDFDFRKYFLPEVRAQYEDFIMGLGEVMRIPIYIDLKELQMSNTEILLDLRLLDYITLRVADSEEWPGQFVQNYGGFDILNLPYQRIGVENIRLYNLISDTNLDPDEDGDVESEIKVIAEGYHDFYAISTFNIERISTDITGFEVYHEGSNVLSTTSNIAYSDYLDVYFRIGDTTSEIPVILNNIVPSVISLANSVTLDPYSASILYWITPDNFISPTSYTDNYYYAKLEAPKDLGTFSFIFNSFGTPIHQFNLNSPTFTMNVIQETLHDQPIYLSEDTYTLQYGDSLLLDGAVLEDDEFLVEGEVYTYNYQEALSSKTTHQLNVIANIGDESFIDKRHFSIFYIDEDLNILPLYINLDGIDYRDTNLLIKDPDIKYIENVYLLNIQWDTSASDFIMYDTNLLVTYKVLNGRPISPLSYTQFDMNGHDMKEHLVEIPFEKYDMVSKSWVSEDDFTEIFYVDKVLNYKTATTTWHLENIVGPYYFVDGQGFNLGITGVSQVLKDGEPFDYSYEIDSDGMLMIKHKNGNRILDPDGTYDIAFHTYSPVSLTHKLNTDNMDYFRIFSTGQYFDIDPSEFVLSTDGYTIYFTNLYRIIQDAETIQQIDYSVHNKFEIKYQSTLDRKIDLSSNLLLLLQDSDGIYRAIDSILIDNIGLYEYEQRFTNDGPLSLPLGGTRAVNMMLAYMPEYSPAVSNLNIDYTFTDRISSLDRARYPYEEGSWYKSFRVFTIPEKTKLMMVDDPSQSLVILQQFYEEREYVMNHNPLIALESGEEYTAVQIDAQAREDYTFTYKLTTYDDDPSNDKPLEGGVVFWQLGYVPKSKSKFLNDDAVITDLNDAPMYFESLGTDAATYVGPGESPNKMFGKPLTDYVSFSGQHWGPYIWTYGITDEFGEVSFDFSTDHDYLSDFNDKIFGNIEGVSSIDDIVLYTRALSIPIDDWNDFAILDTTNILCSEDGIIFDGSSIDPDYNYLDYFLYDSTYLEGLVRMHKSDLVLGVTDYLTYGMPNPDPDDPDQNIDPDDYESIEISLYVTEADPIPTGETLDYESLTEVHELSELEPLPINILDDRYDDSYSIHGEIITPSGNVVEFSQFDQVIQENDLDGGTITIMAGKMRDFIEGGKLGPGISTIKLYVSESDYFKKSPTIMIPLEIQPPNWIKFGEKNTKIDLIDPFINAWGSAFSRDENGESVEMPFESNYPYLEGLIWVEPDFLGIIGKPEEVVERSIQDYIEVNLVCTTDDGSSFPLREGIMLRPGNHEGFMKFSVGLGPEDSFLMNLGVHLNLSFNINYNALDINEDQRNVIIYLLDLKLVENPSSNNPEVLWSINDDGINKNPKPYITVNYDDDYLSSISGPKTIGGNINDFEYGVEISHIYDSIVPDYSIDPTSELTSLFGLSSLVGLVILAKRNGIEEELIEFDPHTSTGDWEYSYLGSSDLIEASTINFVAGKEPDPNTEFKVIYQFGFGNLAQYGQILLGDSNDLEVGWVEISLTTDIMVPSEQSNSPLYIKFEQPAIIGDNELLFTSEAVRNSWPSSNTDLIIFNEQELDINQPMSHNTLPLINLNTAPAGTTIQYGIRSQYELGYGFQEVSGTYSDSSRLIYEDSSYTSPIQTYSDTQADYIDYNSMLLRDPSLYINLASDDEIVLEIYELPLLYAPEVNFTFVLDPIVSGFIDLYGDNFNFRDLRFDFYFVSSEGVGSYYSDSLQVPLNYDDMALEDGCFYIRYNKDLQGLYDTFGEGSFDVYISITHTGPGDMHLPYIILEEFDYICDDHLVEMKDSMPRKYDGSLDVQSVVSTPHYWQIFSLPFRDSPIYNYLPKSPFTPNLLEDSQVTVELEGLPHSSLVALDYSDYSFDYLGKTETYDVNDASYNMLTNLGMFTSAYNIEETMVQDGFVNLYYGSGTEIWGEKDYSSRIYMDGGGVPDYTSSIDFDSLSGFGIPDSWETTFDISDKFLTTSDITVSGSVLYHQLFDLTTEVIQKTDIDLIFDGSGIEGIEFGIQLPDKLSISNIRAVGQPYDNYISFHGFPYDPTGTYIDTYSHIFIESMGVVDTLGWMEKDAVRMTQDTDYSLEYSSTGEKYLLFFITEFDAINTYSINDLLMVDYWAYHTFIEGFDFEYNINENPEDPFMSTIEWNYRYSVSDPLDYKLHPDFSASTSFTIDYTAMEWEMANEKYILPEETDTFTYQPIIDTSVSLIYEEDETEESFSISGIVPPERIPDLADLGDLFTSISYEFWDPTAPVKEDTIQKSSAPYSLARIGQGSPNWYVIHYDQLPIWPDWELVPGSNVIINIEFISTQTEYLLSRTPFNYDYIDNPAFGITLQIDDEDPLYSYENLGFNEKVSKIEDNYIYFIEESIPSGSSVSVTFSSKLEPGILEKKHFIMVCYPWSNIFDTFMDTNIVGASGDAEITYRDEYRKVSGSSIISSFEYSLSIHDTYSLYLSYRLNQRDYFEQEYSVFDLTWDSDYAAFELTYIPSELGSQISAFKDSEDNYAVSVYYFDTQGRMKFLEDEDFNVIGNQVYITPGNPITAVNSIDTFWVSFMPEAIDVDFDSYKFTYNPTVSLKDTIDVSHWDIHGSDGQPVPDEIVLPNLDVFYFMDADASSFNNYICYASQLATYIEQGNSLVFDLASELSDSGDLIDKINYPITNGPVLSLFIDTEIKNYESLEEITVNFLNSDGILLSGAEDEWEQIISLEELIMWDFNIRIDLPQVDNNAISKVKLKPTFRSDNEFSDMNTIGVAQYELAEWNDEFVFTDDVSGKSYMTYTLENPLEEGSNPIAYLFDMELQHLALPSDSVIGSDIVEDQFGVPTTHQVTIPANYYDPDPDGSGNILTFEEGESFMIKYYTPVERAISVAIGRMYFEVAPEGYNPSIPTSSMLLVQTSDQEDYTQFTSNYYYPIPLQVTPFDTEWSGTFKSVKYDLDLPTDMGNFIDFTNMIFDVPYPTYELTIDEISLVRTEVEPSLISRVETERVWQYTEFPD
jgi:hypothetical protein